MGPNSDGRDEQPNQSFQFAYEIEDHEAPSEAVVRAVAAFTNQSPVDLDPLYDVVDPDNLDEALDRPADSQTYTELSFEFDGCEVGVTTDVVHVGECDDPV